MEKILYEKVNHHTGDRPFSLHHTVVGEETTNALYLHYHPEAEFLFLHKGEMQFFAEDREIALKAGDGVYVSKFLMHNAVKKKTENCEYSAVVFSEKWLFGMNDEENIYLNTIYSDRQSAFCYFDGTEDKNKDLLQILESLHKLMQKDVDGYELSLRGELLIVYQNMINLYYGDELKDIPDTNPLQKSIDYMYDNLYEDISLETLAKKSGYSVSHFGHRFKDYTGFTPFEYLNRIRIIKASEILVSSKESVAQIAGKCGFNNISYFNRVFMREFGLTPREYRNTSSK